MGSPQFGVSDGKSAQFPSLFLADSCACECEEAVVAVKLVNAHLLLCFVSWSGGSLPLPPASVSAPAWAGTRFPGRAGKTLGGTCASVAIIIDAKLMLADAK